MRVLCVPPSRTYNLTDLQRPPQSDSGGPSGDLVLWRPRRENFEPDCQGKGGTDPSAPELTEVYPEGLNSANANASQRFLRLFEFKKVFTIDGMNDYYLEASERSIQI